MSLGEIDGPTLVIYHDGTNTRPAGLMPGRRPSRSRCQPTLTQKRDTD